MRFGLRWSRHLHLALTILGYLGPIIPAMCWGPWLLLPLATLPLGIAAERAVWTSTRREPLIPWTPRSAFLSLPFAALLGLGLALALICLSCARRGEAAAQHQGRARLS